MIWTVAFTDLLMQIQRNPVNKMRFETQLGELTVKLKHQLSSPVTCQKFIPAGWESRPIRRDDRASDRSDDRRLPKDIKKCGAVGERFISGANGRRYKPSTVGQRDSAEIF